MDDPWSEFLDIYRDRLDEVSHEEAVVDALVQLMIRLDEAGFSDYGKRSLGLKEETDRWRDDGGDDWGELRSRLEDAWADGA